MMKLVLGICIALALTAGATYLFVANQKAAEFQRERDLLKSSWDAERAELEAALKAAKRPAAVPTLSAGPADTANAKITAQDILERLKKTKVAAGEQRVQSVRHIIHQLESLVDLGSDALPAIKEFLSKFEDVDYSETRADERILTPQGDAKERIERAGPMANLMTQTLPRLDALLPPSLRLGVVQVLKEMGTEQAEQILADMLGTSGRGVEVAYVARVLQEMVPNKYRDVAVAAAKDLLANPPAIDRPNRLDENAKSYLYGVLSMYGDGTFANTAQNLLVTQDGKIDRTALNYLTSALKEDAVPALYQAFKDNRVTNLWERASLASQIFNYAGSNPQANEILKEVVANDSLPAWLRATAIQTVAGGQGPLFGGVAPTDPSQIRARIELLMGLPDTSDERLTRARDEALQKLNETLAADTDNTAAGRSFRTRLDQGQSSTQIPPVPVRQ